jgi:hypothetical protein
MIVIVDERACGGADSGPPDSALGRILINGRSPS